MESEREMMPMEVDALVGDSSANVPRAGAKRRVLKMVGGAAILASTAALAWGTLSSGGEAAAQEPNSAMDPDGEESFVSLFTGSPEDWVNLADENGEAPDHTVVMEWLKTTSQAKSSAEQEGVTGESLDKMRNDVEEALATTDKKEARKLATRAIKRAVNKTKARRRDLKAYLAKHRTLKGFLGGGKKFTTAQSTQLAYCIFDSLSATTSVASSAANLNDAFQTCWGVDPADLFKFNNVDGPNAVHSNVCAVNVFAILGSLMGLSGSLSSAANSCAATLVPEVDAYCAQSVLGLTTAVAGMGGGMTLINSACRGSGWYNKIPAGLVPSNIGNNDFYFNEHGGKRPADAPAHPNRRLSEEDTQDTQDTAAAAPPRQLLFGGGKGSTATQCSVEIAGTMWALASAAMGINSAGRKDGGSCPPRNFLTGSQRRSKSLLYTGAEALCVTDVSQTLVGLLGAIVYIQLAVVNCLDMLNVNAICGSGISAMMAAAAGVSQSSSGIWLACDIGQIPIFHKILALARKVDYKTNLLLSREVLSRRLKEQVDNDIEDLKARFSSPHEAFMSIGLNISDSNAPWRDHGLGDVNLQEVADLILDRDEK